MYLRLILSTIFVASCYSLAEYEMFKGFDAINITTTTRKSQPQSIQKTLTTVIPVSPSSKTTSSPILPIKSGKFQCPEEEQPSNIGAYEVPTQRDIVLLVRETLKRMFNVYHQKAMYFLKDIKEATKSTEALEKNCHGYQDRSAYRRCVIHVRAKSEFITKGLVVSLENQRKDVQAFINGTICNVKGMKADPLELIKTLAMEVASLEFALPGFLRLLSACSVYCNKTPPTLQTIQKKPLRHMTDQDLVVKHFLTKKSYIQLLKGSK